MANGDGSTFVYGGVTFPLSTTSTNTILQDADPSIYWALQYLAAVLTLHIGPRLLVEAAACGAPIENAVEYQTPLDPLPYMLEQQFKFPLLAIYRKTQKLSYRTYNWSHATTQWGVAYVLPPLTAGQAERVVPILADVPFVLYNRIEQGSDPNCLSGAKVWDSSHAGLEAIDLVEGTFGQFAGTGDLMFPAWMGTMEVKERQMPEPALSAIAGVDANHDLATTGDTTIADFVDFKSDVTTPGPTTG